MMLALGVGSWVAAIFHLLTHAFFKALLFLAAGSVIHARTTSRTSAGWAGLRRPMRTTFATFAVGMMALAGVPFLFSGFWSKEAILHAASEWDVSRLPLYAGLAGVVLTAFYMTRLLCEVFWGRAALPRGRPRPREPGVITVPLVVLAIGSIGLGFLGTPAWPWLQSQLTGEAIPSRAAPRGRRPHVLSIVLVADRPRRRMGALRPQARARGRRRIGSRSRPRRPRLFAFLRRAHEV